MLKPRQLTKACISNPYHSWYHNHDRYHICDNDPKGLKNIVTAPSRTLGFSAVFLLAEADDLLSI